MNDNLFINIMDLKDLGQALNDTLAYKRVRKVLFMFLKGELSDDVSIQLVNKDNTLNQSLNTFIKNIKNSSSEEIEEIINKIKKDEESYKELYNYLGDEQLIINLKYLAYDQDKLNDLLDSIISEAYLKYFNKVKNYHEKLCKTLWSEACARNNYQYYQEVLKVLNWFSYEYCKCPDLRKKFIKNHIEIIVKSDHPNKTLELLHLLYLHSIQDQDFPKLKIDIKSIKSINLFTYFYFLWNALTNRNNHSLSLISRVIVAFKEAEYKNKEYKTYRKKLSGTIKRYNKTYIRSTSEVLNKDTIVNSDIDFNELVNDLYTLNYFYQVGSITLKQKNMIAEKLFEKFNYFNTNDVYVKDKLDMIFWFYKGFNRDIKEDEKDFIQQNLVKIMDCDRSREALDIIRLIYFYKLHNKTNTSHIIEKILNSNSPKLFFEKFIMKLLTLNEYPHLVQESDIKNVLDKLKDSYELDYFYQVDKTTSVMFCFSKGFYRNQKEEDEEDEKILYNRQQKCM